MTLPTTWADAPAWLANKRLNEVAYYTMRTLARGDLSYGRGGYQFTDRNGRTTTLTRDEAYEMLLEDAHAEVVRMCNVGMDLSTLAYI